MNIVFFYFILLFKNIICNHGIESINKNKNITFNDIFNHIFVKEKYTIFYFGSQLFYILIHKNCTNVKSFCPKFNISGNESDKSINIYFEDDIETNYSFKNKEINFNLLNKKDVEENYISICINISNSTNYLILNFTENTANTRQTNSDIKEIKYSYNIIDGIAVQLLRGEHFFVKYIFFAYILIVFGCYLLLYGAYHFSIGVIFHVTLFLFYFLNDLFEISLNCEITELIYLYIFLCLIIGISMGIFLNTDKKDNKKYLILKIFHGCSFGFSFFKILIHYYLLIDEIEKYGESDKNNEIYFAASIIFIFIGTTLNLFNPFKKYIFLPASATAGSYYFIKGITYVIGGYYSENILLRYKLSLEYLDIGFKVEIILTYLILTILLIIFSVFYQINHIKQKQEEMQTETISPENYGISRISDLSRTSNSLKPENEKDLINNSNQNKDDDEDDDDINDQED